jgi:hypothetical protein
MDYGGILRINTVSFSYTRKFNLGNFEAVEISVAQWASVDEDEDPDEVVSFLAEQCKNHVKSNIPPGYTRQATPPSYKEKYTVAGIEVVDDGSY